MLAATAGARASSTRWARSSSCSPSSRASPRIPASLRSPSTSWRASPSGTWRRRPSMRISSRSSRRSPSSCCCSCSASSTPPRTLSPASGRARWPELADVALDFLPGLLLGLALGWDPLPAVLLGGVTYISSSSIVAEVLDDLGRLGNSETPAVLSVLVIEDLAMAPYLPLVAVLLAGGSLLKGIGLALAATTLAVGALMLARRHGHSLSRRLHHPEERSRPSHCRGVAADRRRCG